MDWQKEEEGYETLCEMRRQFHNDVAFFRFVRRCPACENQHQIDRYRNGLRCTKCSQTYPFPDGWQMYMSSYMNSSGYRWRRFQEDIAASAFRLFNMFRL